MPFRHLYCGMKDGKLLYVFAVQFLYVLHSIYVLESSALRSQKLDMVLKEEVGNRCL